MLKGGTDGSTKYCFFGISRKVSRLANGEWGILGGGLNGKGELACFYRVDD